MKELYKDILLGTATGDAIGFPVQFCPREMVAKRPVTGEVPTGKWSDDTSLSLCLAESLLAGYNLNDIGKKFVMWLFEGYWTPYGRSFDVGHTCWRAITNLRNEGSPLTSGRDGEWDNGNGSLMRILPLVPFTLDMEEGERHRVIAEVSAITHAHPRSVLACIALCEFAIHYVHGHSLPGAFQHMQEVVQRLLREKRYCDEDEAFDRLTRFDFNAYKAFPRTRSVRRVT